MTNKKSKSKTTTVTTLSVEDRRSLYSAMLGARDLARGWPAESVLKTQAKRVVKLLASVLEVRELDVDQAFVMWPGAKLDFYIALEPHMAEVADVQTLDDGRQVCRLSVDGRQRLWRVYEKPAWTADDWAERWRGR